MSNINLSLDDIIAKTRIHKKINPSHSKGKLHGRKNGGVKKSIGNMRNGGTFTKTVPNGKWKNDKFASADSIRTLVPTSSPLQSVVNDNKKVRMNISNLANTVTTPDLEELFTPYSIESVAVHYGETGEHLGTAEVVLKKKDAQRAINNLKGISIDGSRLVFAIVDGGEGTSIFDRVQFVKKVNRGGIQKRSTVRPQKLRTGNKAVGGRHSLFKTGMALKAGIKGKIGKISKKPKTEEELDAELDSYMKKSEE